MAGRINRQEPLYRDCGPMKGFLFFSLGACLGLHVDSNHSARNAVTQEQHHPFNCTASLNTLHGLPRRNRKPLSRGLPWNRLCGGGARPAGWAGDPLKDDTYGLAALFHAF